MKPREEIKLLTLIRFVSAFLVLAYHFFQPGSLPGVFQNLASNGYKGVVCFFVMSGFILHHVYPSIEGRTERVKFWMARVYRIAPATLLSMTLFIFLSGRQAGFTTKFLGSVVANGLGLSAWTAGPLGFTVFNLVTWTISVEVFFYLLYPGLCEWIRRLNLGWVVGVLVANGLLILFRSQISDAVISWTGSRDAFLFPILWLPYFVHGILLRRVVDRVGSPQRTFWPQIGLWIGVLGLLMLPPGVVPSLGWQFGFMVLLSGVLILSRNTEVKAGPISSVFLFLGRASFSIYLFQFWYPSVAVGVLKKLVPSAAEVFVSPLAYLLGALVFGIGAYLLIEDPARKALVEMAKRRAKDLVAS